MSTEFESAEATWKQLLKTALVGTARHPTEKWAGEGELALTLSKIRQQPGEDREGQLLSAAACINSYLRAGRQPARLPAPVQGVEPFTKDDLPACSAEAGFRLSDLLDTRSKELVREWFRLAARAGKRAPDALLPRLLDAGSKDQDFAIAVLPVLGHRGVWLAAQNPSWNYVDMGDPERTWRTGERFHRLLLLRYLRVTQAASARELVASTWNEETARERAAQLKALGTGLSMEDEPFLEDALDDRAKSVKSVAVELLSRLASSRFVSRMTARARTILTLEPGRGWRSRPSLALNLPEALDDAALRDGIAFDARDKGARRSDWASAILSAVPPSSWSQQWKCRPDKAIQHALASDWDELLVNAWCLADQRHRDEDWAVALLRHDESRAELLDSLSPPRRGQVVLEKMTGKDSLTGLAWAAATREQWDLPTSCDIMKRLHHCFRYLDYLFNSGNGYGQYHQALHRAKSHIDQLGLRVSPSVFTRSYHLEKWPLRDEHLWAWLNEGLEIALAQRLVMREEIERE